MSKYKAAIVIQKEDTTLTIVPYVKAQCGDTENIGFITTEKNEAGRKGKICDEMGEVMQLIQNMIEASILED